MPDARDRAGGSRRGLPLPPPERDGDGDVGVADDQVSRVRMSGILVESRRDLPRLPPPTWQLDDDDDDDPLAPLRADDPIAESTRTVAGGPTAIEATRTAVTTHAVEPT
ncbi:MAG: hypothetical protein KC464_22270, partial [Myxococcales bacterium]|nr:hypothetical protein [Myxococcales bacterium]